MRWSRSQHSAEGEWTLSTETVGGKDVCLSARRQQVREARREGASVSRAGAVVHQENPQWWERCRITGWETSTDSHLSTETPSHVGTNENSVHLQLRQRN